MTARAVASHALWLLLTTAMPACHSRPAEPAPPPATFEIASAPPGARGARAAGTDAAPPPPTAQELADPSAEGPPEGEEPDASAPLDAGREADASPGVAL